MDTSKKLMNKAEKKSKESVELIEDRPVFVPATDIFEKADTIHILCDMPGVDDKSLDISLENDILTLTGRQTSEEPQGYEILRLGYTSGIFQRSFTLTAEIDREKIKAKIANGVLNIELPKSENAKPRKILVTAEH